MSDIFVKKEGEISFFIVSNSIGGAGEFTSKACDTTMRTRAGDIDDIANC